MKVLVTGAAGFIGLHCARQLLGRGHDVVGVDNFNDYYRVGLKRDRFALLEAEARFEGHTLDLADGGALRALMERTQPERVLHLAAQAGVRYSIDNPEAYLRSNLLGFGHVLEACRHTGVRHLVYASSSSVYGANRKLPWSVDDRVDHPVSLYAATKKSNELMAHSYSHLYGFATTGLRYFTVYGPWGRPDMSPWLFTEAILRGEPIRIFNHGRMQRDFTFIDDIAEGTVRALEAQPPGGYAVYNIGNHEPVELLEFIALLERLLGREATREYLPMQPGDVPATYADIDALRAAVGFAPKTPLAEGLGAWVSWFRDYTGL